jgi:glycosyltransferase involved in cell wall biosynthesis
MKPSPLVSVVIPTFNRARVICQTIDNVLEQTYKNIEIIIVDDGSTDETKSKLKRYGDRIRVIIQNNAGPAVARNRGARVACGEIIAFQDSDDLWKPTKLERQVALLARTDGSVPCCLCNADMGITKGKRITSFHHSLVFPKRDEGLWLNVLEVLATRFVLFNQAVAIRREAFNKVGGFDETLKYLEDYDLPLRLSLEGPWAFIHEPLVIYSGASDGSFSQRALEDPFTLKQCELAIFGNILAKLDCMDRCGTAKRHIRRRMKIFRRGITEIRLTRMSSRSMRIIGNLMTKAGHCQDALFRRSPGYPQMLTAAIEAPTSPPEVPAGLALEIRGTDKKIPHGSAFC